MEVRLAASGDLDEIMRIYDKARETMRESGNLAQWTGGYPARELIADDIARQASYVMEGDDARPHAVFMFAVEDDPTYGLIEGGAWLDDEPYGVIHRIGSDGALHGVVPAALEYCTGVIGNIRIDTHADNAIMHHVLGKCGFKRCGTVYCHDGSPRVAYQFRR